MPGTSVRDLEPGLELGRLNDGGAGRGARVQVCNDSDSDGSSVGYLPPPVRERASSNDGGGVRPAMVVSDVKDASAEENPTALRASQSLRGVELAPSRMPIPYSPLAPDTDVLSINLAAARDRLRLVQSHAQAPPGSSVRHQLEPGLELRTLNHGVTGRGAKAQVCNDSDSDGSSVGYLPPPVRERASSDDGGGVRPAMVVSDVKDASAEENPTALRASQSLRGVELAPSRMPIPYPPLSPATDVLSIDLAAARDRLRLVQSHAVALRQAQSLLAGSVESRLESAPQSWESYNRILSVRGRLVVDAWNDNGEE